MASQCFIPSRRLLFVLPLLLLAAALASSPSASPAASSGTTVGATVVSSISLVDSCGARAAWLLGPTPGGSAELTDTGAEVCRFSFESDNASASLRLYQADRAGDAMVTQPTTWSTVNGDYRKTIYTFDRHGTTMVAPVRRTPDRYEQDDILHSLDGGATFSVAGLPETVGNPLVAVPSADVAWLVDRFRILRTADADSASPVWEDLPAGPWNGADVDSIDVIDHDIAWVRTNNLAYRTTDPTGTWNGKGISGCSTSSRGIAAVDATTAFVAGPGRVCMNSDGLAVDGFVHNDAQDQFGGQQLVDIEISRESDSVLWTASVDGRAYRSTAGNWRYWDAFDLPVDAYATDVEVVTDDVVFIGAREGLLFRTVNGGASWTQLHVPTNAEIVEVSATSADDVIVTAYQQRTMWRTTDGGDTWSSYGPGSGDGITDLDAVDVDTLVAAQGNGVVLVGTSAGSSWQQVHTGLAPDNVRGVAVVDEQRVVIVGDRRRIAVSSDGGATWTERTSGTSEDLWDVDVQPSGTLIAVGNGGTILRSTSNGWRWQAQSSSGPNLRRVAAYSDDLALAAGDDGAMLRSTDDGMSWATVASSTLTFRATSLDIVSPSVAYVGAPQQSARSTDGGLTWTAQPTIPGQSYGHVAALTEDIVYRVRWSDGDTQTRPWLWRSLDGGATWTQVGGSDNPSVTAVRAVDGGRMFFGTSNDTIRRTTAVSAVGQYGASTWTAGNVFGGCLQALGGNAVAVSWIEDTGGASPGECEPDDADPWNAVPPTPVTIAGLSSSGIGSVDLVWGFKVGTGTAPGMYVASVVVEAIAPSV